MISHPASHRFSIDIHTSIPTVSVGHFVKKEGGIDIIFKDALRLEFLSSRF